MTANLSSKPTVVVAQANQMDCQLLADVIERQCRLQVTATLVNSVSVISAVQENRPDLVLMSSRLEDGVGAGLEAARTLQVAGATSRAVMLLESDDRALVLESFRCGARGVLTRNDSSHDLSKCMCIVLRGEVWARRMHVKYLVEALSHTHASVSLNVGDRRALSKRDDEVLRLVAAGVTDREIGDILKLNEKETNNYVSDLLEKLGLSSRSDLTFLFPARRAQPFEHEKANVSKDDPSN
jgi:DNA-binding NarL/FixJ family response regulator